MPWEVAKLIGGLGEACDPGPWSAPSALCPNSLSHFELFEKFLINSRTTCFSVDQTDVTVRFPLVCNQKFSSIEIRKGEY